MEAEEAQSRATASSSLANGPPDTKQPNLSKTLCRLVSTSLLAEQLGDHRLPLDARRTLQAERSQGLWFGAAGRELSPVPADSRPRAPRHAPRRSPESSRCPCPQVKAVLAELKDPSQWSSSRPSAAQVRPL